VLTRDRAQWLATVRQTTRQSCDDQADTYDLNDEPIDATHARFVGAVVKSCPPNRHILDAACGTGRYFTAALAHGLRVTATDQSPSVVAAALQKEPRACASVLDLQEIHYSQEFDAALVIDAMEYVPPEDWPVVLRNLHRAVRTGGHLYLTVERTDSQGLAEAYATAVGNGLPVVPGEWVGRCGSYHYYPQLDLVRTWLDEASVDLVEETHSEGTHPSYSYQHYLTRVRR